MSDQATDTAKRSIAGVLEALGLDTTKLPPAELEVIAEAVVGLVEVLGGAAVKRAEAAGRAAAAKITTAEEAEAAERNRT